MPNCSATVAISGLCASYTYTRIHVFHGCCFSTIFLQHGQWNYMLQQLLENVSLHFEKLLSFSFSSKDVTVASIGHISVSYYCYGSFQSLPSYNTSDEQWNREALLFLPCSLCMLLCIYRSLSFVAVQCAIEQHNKPNLEPLFPLSSISWPLAAFSHLKSFKRWKSGERASRDTEGGVLSRGH